MKTLIEIHVLQNFAPSNLNRDDTGAPKDALFGGTRRAAYPASASSAVRQHFIGGGTKVSFPMIGVPHQANPGPHRGLAGMPRS